MHLLGSLIRSFWSITASHTDFGTKRINPHCTENIRDVLDPPPWLHPVVFPPPQELAGRPLFWFCHEVTLGQILECLWVLVSSFVNRWGTPTSLQFFNPKIIYICLYTHIYAYICKNSYIWFHKMKSRKLEERRFPFMITQRYAG